jgi:glyoxylase-like metal-dependent hydrolase (beta-lactamase superfamily II)
MSKHLKAGLLLLLLMRTVFPAVAQRNTDLQSCWKKQLGALGSNTISLSYTEQLNELYHSPEPWQQISYTGNGRLWYNTSGFLKQDTLTTGTRNLYSTMQLDANSLLLVDYNDNSQSAVSQSLYAEKLIESARYTPAVLIDYAVRKGIPARASSDRTFSCYRLTIHKTIVTLYVDRKDKHLAKITTLQNDDLRGDVESIYTYSDYTTVGGLSYPRSVAIEKMNGHLKDEVRIRSRETVAAAPTLLEKPADYKIADDKATVQQVTTEKYNDHLYFAKMLPNGSRIAIVVFQDFLLVCDAPLTTANGELILAATQQIAPGKPVRYFTFGHHHPDYIGGLRAFIHQGTTILGVAGDSSYVAGLAMAPHTLVPDILQAQPKAMKWETIKDSMLITDGAYRMGIYRIGMKSGHTEDYLVYYFPEEKLLLEDDLVWIEKSVAIKKARERQAGLYHAIRDLGLDVRMIMQGWGHSREGYKMDIPFAELERSATMN